MTVRPNHTDLGRGLLPKKGEKNNSHYTHTIHRRPAAETKGELSLIYQYMS
jgi:hypothetical protein